MKRKACLLVFASMFISSLISVWSVGSVCDGLSRIVEVRVDFRWACSIFRCSVSICLSTYNFLYKFQSVWWTKQLCFRG